MCHKKYELVTLTANRLDNYAKYQVRPVILQHKCCKVFCILRQKSIIVFFFWEFLVAFKKNLPLCHSWRDSIYNTCMRVLNCVRPRARPHQTWSRYLRCNRWGQTRTCGDGGKVRVRKSSIHSSIGRERIRTTFLALLMAARPDKWRVPLSGVICSAFILIVGGGGIRIGIGII